jgi:hypothetical protein
MLFGCNSPPVNQGQENGTSGNGALFAKADNYPAYLAPPPDAPALLQYL